MNSRKYLVFILFTAITFFNFRSAQATHAFGAQLTYTALDANRYILTYTLYRDCSGIFPAGTVTINIANSCGFPPQNVTIPQVTSPLMLMPQCLMDAPTTCSGGIHLGIEKYIYSDTITLTGACSSWIVSHAESSRSSSLTTIVGAGSDDLYVYCMINNNGVVNNSAIFSGEPGFYVCLGRAFTIDQGIYDQEGDSISVQMITPLRTSGSIVSYYTGYSGTQPLVSSPAMSYSTTTGIISGFPIQTDFTVYALLVNEYRSGILIGQIERDLSLIAKDCPNTIPDIAGFDGAGNYSATILPGVQSCFVLTALDPDAGQNTTITLETSMAGLSFSNSGGDSASICWTPVANDSLTNPHCFSLRVTDNSCPYQASQVRNFCINVSQIDEVQTDQNPTINIYPNPFRNEMNLAFDKPSNYILQFTDIAGRVVQTEQFSGNHFLLQTTNMENGIYILSVQDKTMNQSQRFKVIKD